jgi:hypothetical protein
MEYKGLKAGKTTPEQLLNEVRHNGISTDQESINNLADVIGNMPIEQVKSMLKIDTQLALFILKSAMNFEQVIGLYNETFEYKSKTAVDVIESNHQIKIEDIKRNYQNQIKAIDKELKDERLRCESLILELETAAKVEEQLKQQVMELKAKLYDLTCK